MNKDINVELVQQQEQITRLQKSRKSMHTVLLVNSLLTLALIIAVIYLYYIKNT
ncbi:MAG: hypothetical protein FWF59_01750 [Turicibacter sp.]|nr:hypothetical protein [Turicibacter sp.]